MGWTINTRLVDAMRVGLRAAGITPQESEMVISTEGSGVECSAIITVVVVAGFPGSTE
jgi:hypothetical protein